jgi:two-component sensor histidine kinase
MLLEHTALPSPDSPIRDLLAEANHRIANSLSTVAALVQQQIAGIKEEHRHIPAGEVRQLLREVRARVDAVAHLHRALSDLPINTPIDVGRYLQKIVSELISTLSLPGSLILHFACELGCRVAPDRALYLGLIVVELVTNSLKYAHPTHVNGKIDMRCWRTTKSLFIEIADDGVGFPDGFNPAHCGKGLAIIDTLAKQIGGSVTYRSDDLGLTCTIEAPVLAAA